MSFRNFQIWASSRDLFSPEGYFKLAEFGPGKLTSSKLIQSESDPSISLKDLAWNLVVHGCSKDSQA